MMIIMMSMLMMITTRKVMYNEVGVVLATPPAIVANGK